MAMTCRAASCRLYGVVAVAFFLMTAVAATKFSSETGDAAKYRGVEQFCTADYKRNAFEESWNSDRPWPQLMAKEAMCRGDSLWGCQKDAVDIFVDQLKARPGSEAFYEAVPCDLYEMIAGRTLWVVGDSMAKNWYRSLRCFLSDFWLPGGRLDVTLGEGASGRQKAMLDTIFKPPDIPNRAHNGMLPICTQLIAGARVCYVRMNIMKQFVDKMLPNLGLLGITRADLMVFNMGIWQKRPGGWTKGDLRFDEYRGNYDQQVGEFARYYEANKDSLPEMVWKDTSSQHSVLADPKPYNVTLDTDGHLHGDDEENVQGGWRNIVSAPVMEALGIPSVETWNQTIMLHYMHTKMHGGAYDCSHYCGPGPRAFWTWRLLETLKAQQPAQATEEVTTPPPETATEEDDPTETPSPSSSGNDTAVDGVVEEAEPEDPEEEEAVSLPDRVQHLCTASYREASVERIFKSGLTKPPLLMTKERDCPVDGPWGCNNKAMDLFVDYLKGVPGNESFYQAVPCDLYKIIAGRTIWIVGDSMAWDWYRSMRCFLSDFWARWGQSDVPLGDDNPTLQKRLLSTVLQPPDIPLRANHGAIPVCTSLVGGSRVCHVRINIMQQLVDKFLPNLELLGVAREDLMVFNTGLWQRNAEWSQSWNQGSEELDSYREGFDLQVAEFAQFYRENKDDLPEMVWKDTPPTHDQLLDLETAQWPFVCKPSGVTMDGNGNLHGDDAAFVSGGWRNRITDPVMKGLGLPCVETWNQTAGLHFMHTRQIGGGYDCMHYCGPGPAAIWTWQLMETLKGSA